MFGSNEHFEKSFILLMRPENICSCNRVLQKNKKKKKRNLTKLEFSRRRSMQWTSWEIFTCRRSFFESYWLIQKENESSRDF